MDLNTAYGYYAFPIDWLAWPVLVALRIIRVNTTFGSISIKRSGLYCYARSVANTVESPESMKSSWILQFIDMIHPMRLQPFVREPSRLARQETDQLDIVYVPCRMHHGSPKYIPGAISPTV
jgi:hypothetical protein